MSNEPEFTDDDTIIQMLTIYENTKHLKDYPCKDSEDDNEPCLTCQYLETCNL